MSDLIDEKGNLLIAPGDIVDKLSILTIKRAYIKDRHKQLLANEEWRRTNLLMTKLEKMYLKNEQVNIYRRLFHELYLINKKQWELEDKVRSDKTGEAAYEARRNNRVRIAKKNDINELFGYPIEVKEYKSDAPDSIKRNDETEKSKDS